MLGIWGILAAALSLVLESPVTHIMPHNASIIQSGPAALPFGYWVRGLRRNRKLSNAVSSDVKGYIGD